MINPYRLIGIGASGGGLINWEYEKGTWRMNYDVLANSTPTQSGENWQSTGMRKPTHSIVLLLQNDLYTTSGKSFLGCSWYAQTSLNHLRALWGASRYATGNSVPFLFIAPSGETFTVAPTGQFNVSEYLQVPGSSGVEYRLELSMQTI